MVSPAHREIFVEPGDSKSFVIALTNNIGREGVFTLGSEDFGVDELNGEPELLGSVSGTNSIKEYIKAPYREIAVRSGETVNIPITVSVPLDEHKQSLFGALTIGMVNGDSKNVTGAKLSSRIAVGIFVRTSEEQEAVGRLVTFGSATGKHFFDHGPISMIISYSNDGGVYLTPGGTITVTNIFGRPTETRVVTPWYVLPNSIRSKTEQLGSKYSFGRYKATLRINNGLGGPLEQAEYTYWVFSWRLLIIVVGAVLGLLLLMRLLGRLGSNSRMT
ncbi:MAG TPA: hypothetical protein VJJ22_01005 [Candidatus Paceibacterota bacterium]